MIQNILDSSNKVENIAKFTKYHNNQGNDQYQVQRNLNFKFSITNFGYRFKELVLQKKF